MTDWWHGLQPRERLSLLLAGLLIASVLVWQLIWVPLQTQLDKARTQVQAQQQLLAWMRQAAAQLKATDQAAEQQPDNSSTSLLSLVDQSARSAGLSQALKKIQPEGDEVRVWLDQLDFDKAMLWLGALQRQGVSVSSLNAERAQAPGQVQMRLSLARSKGQ
ncbi:MAG: type II secretion system protein M [Gammaproteobacteria bacterium SHHR-1]